MQSLKLLLRNRKKTRKMMTKKKKMLLNARKTASDAPEIFDRANTYYKDSMRELKEERATLLEDWLKSFGKLGDVSVVKSKQPKKLKKRKPITREDIISQFIYISNMIIECSSFNVKFFVWVAGTKNTLIIYIQDKESEDS